MPACRPRTRKNETIDSFALLALEKLLGTILTENSFVKTVVCVGLRFGRLSRVTYTRYPRHVATGSDVKEIDFFLLLGVLFVFVIAFLIFNFDV